MTYVDNFFQVGGGCGWGGGGGFTLKIDCFFGPFSISSIFFFGGGVDVTV